MARTRQTARKRTGGFFHTTYSYIRANKSTLEHVVFSLQSLSSKVSINNHYHETNNNKRRRLNDDDQVTIQSLPIEIWTQILSFCVNDRRTMFHLEFTCSKWRELIQNEESALWKVFHGVNPSVFSNKQFFFEFSFVEQFCAHFNGLTDPDLTPLKPPQEHILVDEHGVQKVDKRNCWILCRNGDKNSLNEFDIQCWKEFFHLAYNNQGTMGQSDLDRSPDVYRILQEKEPELFTQQMHVSPPQIQFHADNTFKSQESFPMWDPTIEPCGEPADVVTLQDEFNYDRVKEYSDAVTYTFSRSRTVLKMKRKIEWDSIAVVYCYKPFGEFASQYSRGMMIGKLVTGEYFKLLGSVLSTYYDYYCGCIWITSKLTTAIGADQDQHYVRA